MNLKNIYNRKNKFIAILICVAILLVILFSNIYIASELGHDCIGEHCPICVTIHQCENNLNQMDSPVGGALVVFMKLVLLLLTAFHVFLDKAESTPISLRVRMDY